VGWGVEVLMLAFFLRIPILFALAVWARAGISLYLALFIVFNPKFETNDRYAPLAPINIRCKSLG
jgi:hypothetical protein